MTDFPKPSRRHVLGAAVAASAILGVRRARAAAKTVRLTWGLSGLPLMAKQRGVFEALLAKDGIKVEWVGPFPNHAPSIQAVVGNSAEYSFGGSTTPALAAILAGSPLVFTQFFVVQPRTTAIIAKDSSGITKVEDLKGKTVAVNRSGLGEFLLIAALEKHGLGRDSVRIVYLNPPEAAPAFGSGQVDAWSMWSPQVDIARAQFNGHNVFLEGRDLDFQIDFNSFLVREEWARANPDVVRAVNAAYVAEAAWASANSKEAEILAQKAGSYSDAIRDMFTSWKRQYEVHPVDDQAFLTGLQKAADWLTARKVLPDSIIVRDHLAKLG